MPHGIVAASASNRRRIAGARAWVCLLVLATWSCEGDRAANERFDDAPLVLISIDTLRSDRLPIYGYAQGATPAIDALRRDAILVERAYTHVPLTLPAHASLFTGRLPTEHGVRDNLGYAIAASTETLAEILAGAGYATGGAVSAAILRRSSGIAAGFEVWDEPGAGQNLSAAEAERPGGETLDAIRPWLREVAKRPFFLFLHLYEPHAPYRPPPDLAARFTSPYDGEVAAADATVGAVIAELRALDAYDRAILMLVSDHGEGLGDHGEREHGVFLYRESLQVPMVIKLPGAARAGSTLETPAQLVDVVPTALDLLGLAAPGAKLPGQSLLALDRRPPSEPRRIYAETFYPRLHFGWSELRSLIAGDLHFIDGPDPELYDLAADPAEGTSVLDRERGAARELRAALAELPRGFAEPAAESPETRSRLASLGYLGGSSAAVAEGSTGALPDPRSKLAVLASLETAIDAEARGDLDAAVAALRDLVRAEPDSPAAVSRLAAALERKGALDGSFQEALEARRRAHELARGAAPETLELARLLIAMGRSAEATGLARGVAATFPREAAVIEVEAARHAMEAAVAEGRAAAVAGDRARALELLKPLADRGDPDAMVALATTLSEGGRQPEAREYAERALRAEEGNALAHETLGLVMLRSGDMPGAIEPLRRATTLDPSRANAWNLLGVALERGKGDHTAALAAWQRALELEPDRFDVLYNVATVAASSGDTELARASLARFVAEAPPAQWGAELPLARERLRALGGAP